MTPAVPATPARPQAPAVATKPSAARPQTAAAPTHPDRAPLAGWIAHAPVARVPVKRSFAHRRIAHVHIVQRSDEDTTAPKHLGVPDAVVATVMVPVSPEQPPTPRWPASDRPTTASVVWDSQGLTVTASNSSLKQILRDVATATGLKVEGLSSDERVFGVFGPGLARDVLSEILQGSSYNVIMVGDLGQGAPRRMLLSIRQAANNAPGARPPTPSGQVEAEEESNEEPEMPEQQENIPIHGGFQPGGPPRTPQQIMQEMQQRQLQMQQEQEQQQQQQLQQQPPQ